MTDLEHLIHLGETALTELDRAIFADLIARQHLALPAHPWTEAEIAEFRAKWQHVHGTSA